MVGHRPFNCRARSRAGPGTTETGASRPHIESPRAWCGWERCHAAHAPAFHPTRADQKTRSAEQMLPRISLGPGAQPNTHRDRRGPGQLGGEMLRPSTRPDRPPPMRTDGPGRDGLRAISLHFMHKQTWLSPRFDSDITCACSAVEIRVQIGQNSRSAHLCKHPANVRVALTNGCKYMHETKFEMGADLFSSLGSQLKSPRFKFRALALAPSTEMKS